MDASELPELPGRPLRSPVLTYLRSALVGRDLLLVVLTLAALEGVCRCGFISLDDPTYVLLSTEVTCGLNPGNIAWAFTERVAANWHPLTMLSLQLDATIMDPGEALTFHRTNLVLHLLNVWLLAEVLRRMTGSVWRSAAVAALFAIHPLHVESVAWISERKDVLSTLFGLLGLLAYVRYARQPSWSRLALVLLAQAASLMSKPMLVTFPFLLLLLDYWPLRRWPGQPGRPAPAGDAFAPTAPRRLLLEKVPLLLVSAGFCVLVFLVQSRSGAVASLAGVPLGLRLANAVDATVCYLGQMFYPLHLAVSYPYPHGGLPWWQVLLAGLLLAAITAVVCWQARSRPYLPVGWFWYLGTLVPVIGIVQVGFHARADRYTYVPLIGVFVMLAWGLPDLFPKRLGLLAALTAAALVVCLLLTRAQVRHWEKDLSLWEHTLAVTPKNSYARVAYGSALLIEGEVEEARLQLLEAIHLNPRRADAHYYLACIHESRQEWEKAEEYYRKAHELLPNNGNYRGALLELPGRRKEKQARGGFPTWDMPAGH